MAITENSIKEMRKARLDDRPKPETETSGYVDVVEEFDELYDVYLVSAETYAIAVTDGAAKGIPRDRIVHVPMSQPLRAGELMEHTGLHKDQLIGFFSDMEVQYLTS